MAIERLFPIGDKVLIKPDETNKETASGLILPHEKKASTGTVASVGPGVQDAHGNIVPLQCKPMDRVMFAAVDATVSQRTITLNGSHYLLIPESQVFGIIEETKED